MAKSKKHKYPEVYIEWVDAATHDAWHPEKETREARPHRAFTKGWLISKDEECIRIAHTYSLDDDDDVNHMASLVISTTSITKMIILK